MGLLGMLDHCDGCGRALRAVKYVVRGPGLFGKRQVLCARCFGKS